MHGALGGGSAAVLLLVPWLRPGALLVRDLVAVADPAWSLSLLDDAGRLPRDIPGEVITAAVGQVVPADLFVRIVLLVALIALGAGVGRLLTDAPPAAGLVGGFVAVWNPYVWFRLQQGQWLVLVALAAVPWVVVHLRRDDAWRVARVVVVASLSGFIAWVVVVPTLVVVGVASRRIRAASTGIGAAIVTALPWLLVTEQVGADPEAFAAFAPNADLAGGVVPSLVTGGGYFNAAVASPWRERWLVAIFAFVLAAVALAGVAMWLRDAADGVDLRVRTGLVVAGGLALVTTVVVATGPGQNLLVGLSEGSPVFSVVRDTHRLLAPWVVVLAVGAGAWAGRAGSRVGLPAGLAVAVIGVALVSLPDPIIGPRLPSPSELPAAWHEAATRVNNDPAEGRVLVVPYGQTQRYSFTDGRPVAVPLRRLMRPSVAVDSRLVVGEIVVDDQFGPDPLRQLAGRELSEITGERLAAHGVAWVAVTDPDRFVESPAEGLEVSLMAPTIQLLRVTSPTGTAVPDVHPSKWVLASDLAVALFALLGMLAPEVIDRRHLRGQAPVSEGWSSRDLVG